MSLSVNDTNILFLEIWKSNVCLCLLSQFTCVSLSVFTFGSSIALSGSLPIIRLGHLSASVSFAATFFLIADLDLMVGDSTISWISVTVALLAA